MKNINKYTEKISYIKEFILEHGPCIDLSKVNAADRILYDENYNFDDICDPLYVDYIDLYIFDDEDMWGMNENEYIINSGCYFEVNCNHLTDRSMDYGVDQCYLRNRPYYKDVCSTIHIINGYHNNKDKNKYTFDLIDKVYNFIKKYPNVFKTEEEMGYEKF